MDTDRGSGWLTFSAVVLVFAGIMKIFDSIWAFRVHRNLTDFRDATLGSNVRGYGWWWLIIGILLIIAGFGVLQGSQIGRWFGIVMAAVGGIASLAWMPYEPIWAFTYIAIAILVIYGLSAYGGLEIPEMGGSSGSSSSTTPPPPPGS